MATRIYTRTGDSGETGLFGGHRVSKAELRVEAYGTLDELNAALGASRAERPGADLDSLLQRVQGMLFEVGAVLATPPEASRQPSPLSGDDVTLLERAIDEAEQDVPPLTSFILPGGSKLGASLHLARTVCRRAERHLVALRHDEPSVPTETVTLLNRLGDLLFVLARRANHQAGVTETPWSPRPGNA